MSMNPSEIDRDLQDAIFALSMDKTIPDPAMLDFVVQKYPQYATELTDFATYLVISELRDRTKSEAALDDVDPSYVSPMVSRAISQLNNKYHALQGPDTSDEAIDNRRPKLETVSNPFSRLSRPEFRAFSKKINANYVFVGKLRDRQIEPNTISDGFMELVASELSTPLSAVIGHFSAANDSSSQVRQFYKAIDKPVFGQQESFEEAVRCSELSNDQQEWLLSL